MMRWIMSDPVHYGLTMVGLMGVGIVLAII